jgi:hypothetical protein
MGKPYTPPSAAPIARAAYLSRSLCGGGPGLLTSGEGVDAFLPRDRPEMGWRCRGVSPVAVCGGEARSSPETGTARLAATSPAKVRKKS